MTSYSVDLETKMCTKQMLKSELVKQCIPGELACLSSVSVSNIWPQYSHCLGSVSVSNNLFGLSISIVLVALASVLMYLA